jgi:arginyl-tRNA synthetase
MFAVGYEKYGSQEELAKDPLKYLYDIYVKIDKESKDNTTQHPKSTPRAGSNEWKMETRKFSSNGMDGES